MNTRLKKIRNYMGLSQKKFGNKIFLSQDHISSLENGRRKLTNRSIRDICNEFNVNEDWFRYGKGEMFNDLTDDIEAPEHIKDILRKIMSLNKKDQSKINKILDSFIYETKIEEN